MHARTFTLLTYAIAFATATNAQVPALVKDINPTGNSGVIFLTCFQDQVFFSATDGVHGIELWKSDGTEVGTVMVKDLNPGSGNGVPSNFMEFNGMLHFSATDGVNGTQLWRTDGTESGTEVVLSLSDVSGLLEWMYFAVLEDRIYFRGYDAVNGRELWSSDGTAAGTQLFMDINPGPTNSGFQYPLAHDGKLYFKASDGTNGSEPWVSDGTLAGTHMIIDGIAGGAGCDPSDFAAAGGLVFFRATTSATGDELWATDGTEAGTGLVRDIYPGTNSSLPSYLIEHNGQLHLRAFPTAGSGSALIWQSDGTMAGTTSLPTFGYTNPDNLCSHNGALYITALGISGYRQLWRTDGTAPGTYEILLPSSDVSSPFSGATAMLSCNGDLFFRANYTTAMGQELYKLDITTGSEDYTEETTQPYPNPASDRMVLHLAQATHANLLDNIGRVVRSWWLAAGSNTVDLADLANGAYTLVAGASAHRIMKQ